MKILIFIILAWASPGSDGDDRCLEGFRALRAYYQDRVRPTGDKWALDAESNLSYDDSFAPLLGNISFKEWLTARKQSGRSTHVADFFGSGVFLRDPSSADSITGMRLKKKVEPGMVKGYPNDKWKEIEGNLYTREAWGGIKDDMKARGIPAYDLIVSRPIGPINLSREAAGNKAKRDAYLTAHFDLIARGFQLLSKEDGLMIIEVPFIAAETKEFKDWVGRLKSKGFDVIYHEENILGFTPKDPRDYEHCSGALRIRRTKDSPDELSAK